MLSQDKLNKYFNRIKRNNEKNIRRTFRDRCLKRTTIPGDSPVMSPTELKMQPTIHLNRVHIQLYVPNVLWVAFFKSVGLVIIRILYSTLDL
jgi:hypothetical protein